MNSFERALDVIHELPFYDERTAARIIWQAFANAALNRQMKETLNAHGRWVAVEDIEELHKQAEGKTSYDKVYPSTALETTPPHVRA